MLLLGREKGEIINMDESIHVRLNGCFLHETQSWWQAYIDDNIITCQRQNVNLMRHYIENGELLQKETIVNS